MGIFKEWIINWDQKTIVVTGGTSGIGKQVALELIALGADVFILGRDEDKFKILSETTGAITCLKCDVTSEKSVQSAFSKIKELGKCIYGLVNNAGINPSRTNILDTTLANWQKTIETNLTGAFNCAKQAIPQMIELGGGSLVNISSIAGISALNNRAAYMSSKWGLIGLSKSIAMDFAKMHIRSNVVCPGYTSTPLVENYLSGLSSNEHDALNQAHPLGGIGIPENISKAILFFLSDESKWITGTVLPVDGGFTLGKEYENSN